MPAPLYRYDAVGFFRAFFCGQGRAPREAVLAAGTALEGLGFGVWGLGFGVWGLGFGVWGLGFGVWGEGGFFVLFFVWGFLRRSML